MKKWIIAVIIAVIAYAWYSDQQEKNRQAERDRQNAEAVGAFVGGFLKGVTE